MQDFDRYDYKISIEDLGILAKSDIPVTVIINGEYYELEKPQEKMAIENLGLKLNDIEKNYEVRIYDYETGIIQQHYSSYGAIPKSYRTLIVKDYTVRYFDREIRIGI